MYSKNRACDQIRRRGFVPPKSDMHGILWYNILAGYTRAFCEGGEVVGTILAFMVSVAAGLFVEALCRWLDGRK